MRICEAILRVQPDQLEIAGYHFIGLLRGYSFMKLQDLRQLIPHTKNWVQSAHGPLEYYRNLFPTNPPKRHIVQRSEVLVI
jgi:hypothetical protein